MNTTQLMEAKWDTPDAGDAQRVTFVGSAHTSNIDHILTSPRLLKLWNSGGSARYTTHTMFGRLQYGHRAARWSSAEGMEQALGFAHTADEIRSWRHQQQTARRKADLRRQQLAPLREKEKGSEYRKAVLANLPESIHTARTWLEFWREHAGGWWEGRPADAPYRMLNAQAKLVSVSPRMKSARSPRTAVELLQQAPSVSDYADTEITVAWC